MLKQFVAKVIPCFVVVIGMGGAGFAKAGTNAQSALGIFAKEKGSEALKGVAAVRGLRGQDQPDVWEIIVRDSNSAGDACYLVDGKRILKSGRVKEGVVGAPLALASLSVDSPQAFRIADAEARRSKVGFDSIDYELRATPKGRAPLWLVRLRDAAGNEVALVEIDGANGAVAGGKRGGSATRKTGTTVANVPRREIARETVVEESAGEMHAENRGVVDYGAYRKREKETTPEEHRRALGGVWERSTNGIDDAGTRMKSGFSKIGTAIGDVFCGRADYRPSGQQRWSPNRGAASRGN